MALSPGTRIGSYEVTTLLGVGGMGEVYRAHDLTLDREVALKILPPEFARDAERVARFRREAKTVAAINHPHIAQIHGLDESADGSLALVMELVEGDDLSQRIRRGPIAIDEALPIARQIAEALEAAHEQGIVHRDLKPANIKVRDDGTVKVLDFGLAKAIDQGSGIGDRGSGAANSPTITSPAMTMRGVILGTAAYMAPEQAKGKAVDRRADIWAFGCVLYEMLVGARAFDGEDTTEILGAIVKTEPDWKQLPKSTAPQIIALLRRCLQKDPRKRQQHIGDARIEIDETMTVPSAPGERARPASHVYAPWALAGLSAAALAVALLIGRPAGPTAVVSRVDITTPSISGEQQLVDFALSPDGRRIAYIAGPGFGSLWVRSLDDIQERQLPATEAPWHPFWSPDGRSLGFFSNGKLKRIDVDGGTPVVIADVTLGTGGTWSADGTIVYADFYVKTLWRVAATGGAPVALPTVEGGLSYAYPHFLPGGDRYLFASLFGTKGGWFIGTLDGKAPRPVQGASPTFTQFLPPNHLVYLQDGELRAQPIDIERAELTGSPEKIADAVAHSPRMVRGAFAVSAGGTIAYRTGGLARQLAWFDRQGRLLGRIGQPDMAPVITAAVSPDATRIALDRTAQNNRDVWMMEVSSGSVTRVTAHADEDGLPVWAPDGRRLAYESMRQAGFYSLFVRQLNSPQTETLLRQDADRNFWPLDWSRDGRHLLYLEAPDVMRGDIYALPMTGPDRTPIPVAATPFEEMNGAFSPDGAWVAYQTNQSGRQEIVVQAFPDAAKGSVQVSVNGGATPKWSPDGRELYFMAPDGKLMATVIAATDAGAKSEIPRSLFQTAAGYWFGIPQYDVDRQGRFLMDIGGHPAPPIRLLLNWKPGATP